MFTKVQRALGVTARKGSGAALVNKLLALYRYQVRSTYAAPFPTALQIEPTNACNLSCPTCPAGSGKLRRPIGFMDFKLYKKILDETGKYLINITLHNYGESFLHKDLIDMIEYATSWGITSHLSTNGHFFRDQQFIRRLVCSGLQNLKISLDGASQETYERFRMGGDFNAVIKGTRDVILMKRRLGRKTPVIEFQFILMKPNEHDLERVKEIAREVDIDRLSIKSVHVNPNDPDFHALADMYVPEDELKARFRKLNGRYILKVPPTEGCWWPYEQMVINCDGSVVACCYDTYDELLMGNIITEGSVRKIWNNKNYRGFRYRLWHAKDGLSLCWNCPEGREF
jgi:radical SAM protein with 4Fe4S-binding SPASM domain